MMKSIFWLMLLAVCLLAGCGVLDDGRMAAHKDIRVAEEKTKQGVLQTRREEISAKKTPAKANPTFKSTTYDQTGKIVAVTEMDLQPLFAELGQGKDEAGTYGVELKTTETPKGQTAEAITAATGFVAEAGSAPATIVYTTGKGIGMALKETNGGTKITGESINIDGAFNRADNTAIGSGNSVTSGFNLDRSTKSEIAQKE
ncbi:MAG: hypothetical protein KJ630_13795 [Proteobacteria bacterium]|nr:hypothetical protein [Pseudomonadota bacterium]